MFKRGRKRKITTLILIALMAFLWWVKTTSITFGQRTRSACNASEKFFQLQDRRPSSTWPEDGEEIIYIGGSHSSYVGGRGGEGYVYVQVVDASHDGYDPARQNYLYSDGGRVAYVVDFSPNPVIEIHHSNTPRARDMATRMLAALSAKHKARIVSTTFPKGKRLNAKAATDGQWIVRLTEFAQPVILLSTLAIAFILVWSLAEYTVKKRFYTAGFHCNACGYDLRGTPGDRCSECGEPI